MTVAGGFQHGLQHDCHEALTFILSIAHEEETRLLKQRRREANIHTSDKSHEFQGVVARNFGIMERVVLTCQCPTCRNERSKVDLGFIISLPLGSASSAQAISVETVFSASSDAEAVEATCSKCGCLTADSRRSFVAVGSHVIIQLKRFRWNAALNSNSKDSTAIALSPVLKICKAALSPLSCPRSQRDLASASRLLSFEPSDDECQVDIDLEAPLPSDLESVSSAEQQQLDSRSSSIESSFSLVGTVMHAGRSLDSGHYYADVLCDSRWIRVDDTSVQHLEWDPQRVQNPSWSPLAYVQIYSCPSIRSNSLQIE